MSLSVLIILPLINAIALLLCNGLKPVRLVALSGSVVQLIVTLGLLFTYWQQRTAGNKAVMLFEEDHVWFTPLNIHYHIGVDGISIAMILLTAFVTVAGVLVSWK